MHFVEFLHVLGSAQISSSQLKSAQISSNQLKSAQISSNQLKSARISSSQLKISSTEFKSGQKVEISPQKLKEDMPTADSNQYARTRQQCAFKHEIQNIFKNC